MMIAPARDCVVNIECYKRELEAIKRLRPAANAGQEFMLELIGSRLAKGSHWALKYVARFEANMGTC